MANYSYLSDGTKLEAVDGGGEGLVYRGPFVYRKSPGGSSLTLESVAFGGGRLAAGKEDQDKDFGTSYTDFGARQYSPQLRRWMTPDPMSENYYGTSPYTFCNNNPVNFVDPDGEDPSLIWDIASIGFGIDSFRDNYRSGKYGAAVFDGSGIDALKLGDELSSFSHAAEFGVDSYKNLKKSVNATYGTGSGL